MTGQAAAEKRLVGLTKLLNAVIHGHRELKRLEDGNRFLEALCAQTDASKCVEHLIAAPEGIPAIAKAFRLSGEGAFLNGPATSVLRYLSHPSIKQLYAGQFLHRILESIVQPPTFWKTFVTAYDAGNLTDDATLSFAWLLFERLCSRSGDASDHVRDIATRITNDAAFIKCDIQDLRNFGHKIKHVLDSTSSDPFEDGPGGRHDNDFADYRKIKITPTTDEFESTEEPFYRKADVVDSEEFERRGHVHLDNHFRLLREDLLGELRSDYQIAIGAKKGRQKTIIHNVKFIGISFGVAPPHKQHGYKHCLLEFRCDGGISQLAKLKGKEERKKKLKENKNLLKHQSLGCLISNGHLVAFASVDRDEDKLAQKPPVIALRIADNVSFKKVLTLSKSSSKIDFVQVDTAMFAYEPILQCLQNMPEMPLPEQLFNNSPAAGEALSGIQPSFILEKIRQNREQDMQNILHTPRGIKLDDAQADSLLAGISKRVSLIQGPPGTGKSFIGALIAKVLHDHTSENILVETFTNHALDQFLDDLQQIGIPSSSIVRLGKPGPTTQALGIRLQPTTYKESRQTLSMRREQMNQADGFRDLLMDKIKEFGKLNLMQQDLLDYLEFSEDSKFFDAFQIPQSTDGMTTVGKSGKKLSPYYLLEQWFNGKDAGIFKVKAEQEFSDVWAIAPRDRNTIEERWTREIVQEHVDQISHLAQSYDQCRTQIDKLYREKDAHILCQKRIIGCTTTGAAMYADLIQKAAPAIVIVEEAGEILESHVLTAMSSNTKQLILIGDHKQLRPKVNNYSLTIEKGDGYNLNQSLFERLVLGGVPHLTLNRQHRMRPEISTLVRSLTYPELEDAPKTKGRPSLRGFQDNVIFVSHNEAELNARQIADRRDEGASASKENEYEVGMVLKCVRYLGQQGYGTDQLVVLTPYLGQLHCLVKALSKENDPILNDLDSFELIRAGLLSPAGADISKRKIKISTIDNYQGEESDIVIASLTRSNDVGDIGFMSAPQRVNVLLSRARNALIMIGNAQTFMNSRKGKEVWVPLMDQLKREGHVYNGFPLQCQKHPQKKALLSNKESFDLECPDGGCSEPCGTMLNCNMHECPHRCHQLEDHSKMQCKAVVKLTCPKGHKFTRLCYDQAKNDCRKCADEAKAAEKRRKREWELEQERQVKQNVYAAELSRLDAEIEHEKRIMQLQTEDDSRHNVLEQRKLDLANLKKTRTSGSTISKNGSNAPTNQANGSSDKESPASSSPHLPDSQPSTNSPPANTSVPSSTSTSSTPAVALTTIPLDWDKIQARDDWEWQKLYEGAENKALDTLMAMIGLESVKEKFLTIKNKVDIVVRQNVSLEGERFGAVMLGNPGTGKTTVARLYANFLVKFGALPGDHFIETSGSALANDGVSACKGHIETILKAGGGVFFIDEAYQLVSGNSPGGKAVLDYLLAEIENLTGQVVFVLAGYHKQMEAFFAHNPGIPSRIPIQMEFRDYTDQELHQIFIQCIETKYKNRMNLEEGMKGLYARIVARRIGRGRGREGFGNARDVQNKISQITERQAKRIQKQRKTGQQPDDYLLTKEDLIGPEPSSVLKNNASWKKLQEMIGLTAVKDSIDILLNSIQSNYQRELAEKPPIEYSLNKCFIGSPGTGKTTVAKLYGRILADIGLLSNGEVVMKNPADFVGDVIGASETKTKAILASTIGKVLIIDEAYMLAGGGKPDVFKIAVIDTLVAEVQSVAGDDRCVLLLGYKDQMEEMFRDTNPGLARRFPLNSSFSFEDFSDPELRRILDLKLKDIGYDATDQAKKVAMETLQRARNRPNFGNAGEVDIVLDRAKALHQNHLASRQVKHSDTLEAIDFDQDFDRASRAATNLPKLFEHVVGCESIIKQIQGYQTTAANMLTLGMDPRDQIPFNFLFKGPPGTGKTTTAQKMGKVYYDMGFLGEAKVVECSATDLVGQYVGHTGPKVQKLLEKALGKVLFIDEAYRLAEGHFATEAMDELVDCLTKPKYASKLICILAGYDKDIDRLMSMNPGLTSRFPESIVFPSLDPKTCFTLLTKVLETRTAGSPLNLDVLTMPAPQFEHKVIELFKHLSKLDSWGNARDVKFVGKGIFSELISSAAPPITRLDLTEEIVIRIMETILSERSRRNEAVGTTRRGSHNALPLRLSAQQQRLKSPPQTSAQPNSQANTSTVNKPPSSRPASKDSQPQQALSKPPQKLSSTQEPDWIDAILKAKRDPGISDAVWKQLNIDKHAAIAREREYLALQEKKQKEEQRIKALQRAEENAVHEEERRKWEKERIEAELERRRKEAILEEKKKQREREMRQQHRLKELGPCPMGYRWIKQSGGYRCAGGSHWLSDAALGV